jgi:hypothetical protein
VGFGLGYSATHIQGHAPRSHTILEMHPVVRPRRGVLLLLVLLLVVVLVLLVFLLAVLRLRLRRLLRLVAVPDTAVAGRAAGVAVGGGAGRGHHCGGDLAGEIVTTSLSWDDFAITAMR